VPRLHPRRARRSVLAAVVVLAGPTLTACSSGTSTKTGTPTTSPAVGSTTSVAPAAKATVPSRVAPASATLEIAVAPWQLPEARAREVVLAGDHALLVIGGLDPGGASTARVWNVALPGGVTTRLAVLPQTIHDSAGAVIGRDAFVFGGGSATELATVQRYRAGVGSVVGNMPQARSDLVAVEVSGTAYVLGGFDGSSSIASVLATTDGANFRTVAQLPQTVRYPAVAVLGGRIWLFGGTHNGSAVTTIQRIDPTTGDAAIAGQLPAPLADASAVAIGGRILVLGGRSRGRILDSVVRFDPASGQTSMVGTLPYPVADAGAAVVDGVGYLVGGENPAKTASTVILRYR
jgi:N-acetylneuraminic acid mutarotase